jgi:hypothetical protein
VLPLEVKVLPLLRQSPRRKRKNLNLKRRRKRNSQNQPLQLRMRTSISISSDDSFKPLLSQKSFSMFFFLHKNK